MMVGMGRFLCGYRDAIKPQLGRHLILFKVLFNMEAPGSGWNRVIGPEFMRKMPEYGLACGTQAACGGDDGKPNAVCT